MRQKNYEILEQGSTLMIRIFAKQMSEKEHNQNLIKMLFLLGMVYLGLLFWLDREMMFVFDFVFMIILIWNFRSINDQYQWLKIGYEELVIDLKEEVVIFKRKYTKIFDEIRIPMINIEYFGREELLYYVYDLTHLEITKSTSDKKNTLCLMFVSEVWRKTKCSILHFGAVLEQLEVDIINSKVKNFMKSHS